MCLACNPTVPSLQLHVPAKVLYRDGSMQNDIPLRELASQFHATHFIVSQVNPHLLPFLNDPVAPCSPLYRLQALLVT